MLIIVKLNYYYDTKLLLLHKCVTRNEVTALQVNRTRSNPTNLGMHKEFEDEEG